MYWVNLEIQFIGHSSYHFTDIFVIRGAQDKQKGKPKFELEQNYFTTVRNHISSVPFVAGIFSRMRERKTKREGEEGGVISLISTEQMTASRDPRPPSPLK